MILKTGDHVIAIYDGRQVAATVTLASPNGRSLMIAWADGMLGGHCGMMPVFQEETGEYRSLMEGREIMLIKVIPDDEAEKAEFVVCMRDGKPTPFDDNQTGVCCHCNHAIIFRPYVPKGPAKICLECAVEFAGATRQ